LIKCITASNKNNFTGKSKTLEKFWVAGINYKKTSLDIRSKFAFNNGIIEKIYEDSSVNRISNFFILSTCNRTEIYSTSEEKEIYKTLFKNYSSVSKEELEEHTFFKSGKDALKHLFKVAAGLESQIIGDYEIVGQLKTTFQKAKEKGLVDGKFQKIINTALQSSKAVRTQTHISDGTTSVSYAVIQLMRELINDERSRKICLIGLGKMGSLTLKNLKKHLHAHQLIIVNRNEEKAHELANQFGVQFLPFENQQEAISSSDILIVATGADHAIITKEMIEQSHIKLIFDLSVPSNVDAAVNEIKGIQYFNVDSLSQIVNKTLVHRKQQVPIATEIIQNHIDELFSWEQRKKAHSSSIING
jgi:glutamyl-tRNA reductase